MLLSFKPVASVVTVDIIMLDIRWYFVLSYHRLNCLAWWHNPFDVGLASKMRLRNDSREVVHTVVSLSPSSISGQWVVMLSGWEDNRRSRTALAMHYRLQWHIQP